MLNIVLPDEGKHGEVQAMKTGGSLDLTTQVLFALTDLIHNFLLFFHILLFSAAPLAQALYNQRFKS